MSLKDGVWSSDQLGQFGVGEDSAVGVNFQTDPQDHWRGGLQGLTHTHTHTKKLCCDLLNADLLRPVF